MTYNGSAHSITVGGSKPKGVTVQYEGNAQTNAGEYTVTAKFYYNNEYISGADKTAKLTVNKADYDMSGVSFTGSDKTYNGTALVPSITGTLPSGVSVTYDTAGAELVNAGTYTVTASFTGDANHNPIAPVSADFVINKAVFDTSGYFKTKTVSFNGEYHSIALTGTVPSYITVTFENNRVRAIGTHTVTAIFSADPNNVTVEVPERKANLMITQGSYSTSELTFEELDDGTYAVTGYTGTKDFVVIPKKHNNADVTSVKTSAFEGNTAIGYVFIPNTVTNIGNKAFKDCTALTEIRLSTALENIGAQAFAGVGAEAIVIPDSVTSIAQGAFKDAQLKSITLPFVGGSRNSSNEYLGYIFGVSNAEMPSNLKTVIFSDECTEIPAYAFNGCKYIENFVIGEKVATLGSAAFGGCSSLRSIYLPKTLTTILANTEWANSPFAGCGDELMIVMEGDINLGFGQYWSNISATETALVIYMKDYDDYLENGESFRDVDLTDATLADIYLNGKKLNGFVSSILEYSASSDINTGYPVLRAVASSAASRVVIDKPTPSNGGIASITVTSGDGTVKVYKVDLSTVSGTLNTGGAVVNKDGADATVSFVIDDGQKTNFHKNMLQKYSKLSLTFAIWTKDFATLTETGDKTGYVMNGDKYTYTQTDAQKNNVAFWDDVLKVGRSEIVSHTHTHEFWGTNDDGGTFEYVKNNQEVISTATMPKGSSSKEVYASKQIIEEIFGANSYLGQNAKNLVIIHAGIGVRTSNFTVGGKVIPTYLTYYNSLVSKAMSDGDYIGGRGTFQVTTPEASKSKVTTPAMMKDANYRRSINAYMIVTENRNSGGHWSEGGIDNWTAYIDHAIKQNGLAAYCIHNIIPNPTSHSGHNISEADAEALYSYAASKNVWIATFTDAVMYYSEWSTANVNVAYADEKVKVTLTDSEKDDVYNIALTVKVNVPALWESAKVGSDELTVHRNADGTSYVYVNIVPDSGTVEITEG